MKPLLSLLTVTATALLVSACEKKPQVVIEDRNTEMVPRAETKNFETARLGKEIDAYEKTPTAAQAAGVDRAFAELDGEIAELNERVSKTSGDARAEAAQKAANLTIYRTAEAARFAKAKALATGDVNPANTSATGDKIEDAAKKTGEAIGDAARKVGEGVKDAAEAVRDAAKN